MSKFLYQSCAALLIWCASGAEAKGAPDSTNQIDTAAISALGATYLHDPVSEIRAWIDADSNAAGMIESATAGLKRRNRNATITTLSGLGLTTLGFVVGFTTGDCEEQPAGGTHCESPAGLAIAAPGLIAFTIGIGMYFADPEEKKILRRKYNSYVMEKRFR